MLRRILSWQPDSTLVTLIGSFGTIGTLVITFYRWYWVPRRARIERERTEIYRPLHEHVGYLLRYVTEHNYEGIKQNARSWDAKRKTAAPRINKILDEFLDTLDEYYDWFVATRSWISLLVIESCLRWTSELGEYVAQRSKGIPFTQELVQTITPAMINGVRIKKSWVNDNTDLYEKTTSQSEKALDRVFNDIDRVSQSHFELDRLRARLRDLERAVLIRGETALKELAKRA